MQLLDQVFDFHIGDLVPFETFIQSKFRFLFNMYYECMYKYSKFPSLLRGALQILSTLFINQHLKYPLQCKLTI